MRVLSGCGSGRIPSRTGERRCAPRAGGLPSPPPWALTEIAAIAAAGMAAGAQSTPSSAAAPDPFPVLLTFGSRPLRPTSRTRSGSFPAQSPDVIGYRRELEGGRRHRLRLAIAPRSSAGSPARSRSSSSPEKAFETIVPVFIAIALVSVVLQPRLDKLVAGRAPAAWPQARACRGVFVYLAGRLRRLLRRGAGILLLAILGLALPDDLQRVNAAQERACRRRERRGALVFHRGRRRGLGDRPR